MTQMLFNINNINNNNNNKRPTRRLGIQLPPLKKTSNAQSTNSEKLYWGRPTWIFFHTLVEKINEEHFHILNKQLCDFILQICVNLPCPICATHAHEYMKNVNFNNITTKQSLKRVMFDFHNEVNKRKNYNQFNINNLDNTYSNVHLIRAFNDFIRNYHMNGAIRYMVETGKRKQLVSNLSKWFKSNLHCFSV